MIDDLVMFMFPTVGAVFLVVAVVLWMASEAGYRAVRAENSDGEDKELREARREQATNLQGALLGLLGLLLGFSFAMAVNRFDARKSLVLEESNAIGTAWLRSGFLQSPQDSKDARNILTQYVDARLQMATVDITDATALSALQTSEKLQTALWTLTERQPSTPLSALFAVAVNDLIDLDSKRQAALNNNVPGSVWVLLVLVSLLVCWLTGYTTHMRSLRRGALPMIILPALLTIVITIICDLDRPRQGLIHVSQNSMTQLKQTLKKYTPAPESK